MKIYMSYVMYLYEDTMYYEICVYGDIRVLCKWLLADTHVSCNTFTRRYTCIM